MTDAPRIHHFEEPLPLDGAAARRWLGGKGASVAEMTSLGLPVPPGLTLSTDVWRAFDAEGALPASIVDALPAAVARVEAATGRRFGDPDAPLLLSVRSGGPTSMPGMLDTVLDVGVSPAVARGLGVERGDPRFALDVRRRFCESFATVVLGVPRAAFDALLGRRAIDGLEAPELEALLVEMERCVAHEAGRSIPDDPWEQLRLAIEGVLRSWRSERAAKYRDAHGIDEGEGTGVTLQAMVFGNLGARSGAGVVYSRNPATGEPTLYGEWLPAAQGEDVVGGRRTPDPLTRAQVRRGMDDRSLESAMPAVVEELRQICGALEARYGDVMDVEFTVEEGRLYVLQCRSAKRSPRAAVRIAASLVDEGMLERSAALRRLEPASLRQLLTPRLPDPEQLAALGRRPLARGLAASPGAASGRVVLDVAAAEAARGEDLVLVRAETSAEDVEAMRHATGILTAAGGLTCHAAVVARAMGKPCVAGATSLHVDYVGRRVLSRDGGGRVLEEGDVLTIDGTRGLVYEGSVDVEPAPASEHVTRVLAWASEVCRSLVLAEASAPRHVALGRRFGSDGAMVRGAAPEDLSALIEAAEAGRLFVVAERPEVLDALSAGLRARDAVLLPAPLEAAPLPDLTARGVEVWVADGPGRWRLRGGDGALVEGDERAGATLAALREAGRDPLGLVVPPLDVPVGRLLAAQIDGA